LANKEQHTGHTLEENILRIVNMLFDKADSTSLSVFF